ncbi:hypothetical protein ANCCAN_10739 [Ancylostoma caninum]|uniref:Uncharacterized protein n=1 Tax=Ancylostoma caninum TaxID=29170 RepID=A0A368GFW5_ANCCA|nr:hypothetical protein ANCCAN_10739 [Ancylostoma caninum]
MLKLLRSDRVKWKAKLFKALQRALKDIRSYSYSDCASTGFRWITNNRQSISLPRDQINDENDIDNNIDVQY